jgi:hypothetical protein
MGLPPFDAVETFVCWAVAAIVSAGKLAALGSESVAKMRRNMHAAIQAPPIRNLRRDYVETCTGQFNHGIASVHPF